MEITVSALHPPTCGRAKVLIIRVSAKQARYIICHPCGHGDKARAPAALALRALHPMLQLSMLQHPSHQRCHMVAHAEVSQ